MTSTWCEKGRGSGISRDKGIKASLLPLWTMPYCARIIPSCRENAEAFSHHVQEILRSRATFYVFSQERRNKESNMVLIGLGIYVPFVCKLDRCNFLLSQRNWIKWIESLHWLNTAYVRKLHSHYVSQQSPLQCVPVSFFAIFLCQLNFWLENKLLPCTYSPRSFWKDAGSCSPCWEP